MEPDALLVFGLGTTRTLAGAIAAELGRAPSPLEERDFEDGEHKIRPLVSVRGRDVYVVASLYGEPGHSPNDKLCRTLFFVAAARDAGADRITVVAPYLCYSRKDRRTKPRDPVTTRYVARLFEASGTDRLVTVDVHNPAAFQNAFRIPTEHLEARRMFVASLLPEVSASEVIVMSPDAGGEKRADRLRQELAASLCRDVPLGFLEKYRSEGVVSGEAVVGDVAGRYVIVVDDLVASGTTLARAAEACRANGAHAIAAVATHGVFVGDASRVLSEAPLDRIVVTDTIPPFRLDRSRFGDRLLVLPIAPLLAEAIRRLHEGGSIVELTD